MPLKLVTPRLGKTDNFYVRGTHLGIYVNRSAKTGDRKIASKLLRRWQDEIERDAYAVPGAPTFASAAVSYMQDGGERRFLAPLIRELGAKPLSAIVQATIDEAARAIKPVGTNATRNRQVHTPVSAVLRHAGVRIEIKRPAGAAGVPRVTWLKPEEAFRLLRAADAQSAHFGALCAFLLYTGVRLSEALRLTWGDVELDEARAFIRETKNGDPITVHLPPQVVAALLKLGSGKEARVFRLSKAGRLYSHFTATCNRAEVDIPERVAFHIFRHTYGAWMRRYAGLDTSGLVATKRWKSRVAASVYEHADVTEESMKADLLPVEEPWNPQGDKKQ